MQRFTDPLLLEVLNAMRTPGGKRISQESWQALVKTQIHSSSSAAQPAGTRNPVAEPLQYDQRLREARGWYESAYEWRIVSYAMHTQAKLDAHDAGQVLFYVPAVDRPAAPLSKEDVDEMRAEPNIGSTGKMLGLLPLFVGIEVILTETLLPPRYVRGAPGKVVGIELHPMEPLVEGRTSIVSDGVVLLHYMPKCVYIQMEGSNELFLQAAPGTAGSAPQPAGPDLRGVLAITPQARPWKFKPAAGGPVIPVSRTQLPCYPKSNALCMASTARRQIQASSCNGRFRQDSSRSPCGWHYVSLSRPRSF